MFFRFLRTRFFGRTEREQGSAEWKCCGEGRQGTGRKEQLGGFQPSLVSSFMGNIWHNQLSLNQMGYKFCHIPRQTLLLSWVALTFEENSSGVYPGSGVSPRASEDSRRAASPGSGACQAWLQRSG